MTPGPQRGQTPHCLFSRMAFQIPPAASLLQNPRAGLLSSAHRMPDFYQANRVPSMECASFLGLLSLHGHRGADVTPGAAGSAPCHPVPWARGPCTARTGCGLGSVPRSGVWGADPVPRAGQDPIHLGPYLLEREGSCADVGGRGGCPVGRPLCHLPFTAVAGPAGVSADCYKNPP